MMFSLRSPTRPIGVTLICLMVLTQTSCATLQMSPSLTPEGGDGGSGERGEEVSDLPGMGRIVVVAAVLVGGYLLYRAIINNRGEAEGESESASSLSPPVCTRLVSPDPGIPRRIVPMTPCLVPTPPSFAMPFGEAKRRPFASPHLR
jgi:hypothetical protein